MARRGVLRCLAAAVLFGASAPASSALAADLPALVLAGLLYLGALIAVVPSCVRHPPAKAALREGWASLAGAVVLGGAVGPVLLVAGLARTSAASASLLLNLELLATVALAATIFREHLGRRVIGAAVLLTVAGVLLVVDPELGVQTGALLIVAACVCWGIDNSLTAKIDRLAPHHITAAKGLVAGSANLALGLWLVSEVRWSASDVMAALLVGALGYGASITLWVQGARDLGAARAQVIFASAPFIGAAIAWTVLGESATWIQMVAVVIAIGGIVLSLDSAHDHEHHHEALVHDHEHTHDDGHHDHDHPDGFVGRHRHLHEHNVMVHAHPHVPDLHHAHPHGADRQEVGGSRSDAA